MSIQLPIGPLQIVIDYSDAGTTEISTGTIVVNPASPPAEANASIVLTIRTILIQPPGGAAVTRTENSTQTQPAIWTPDRSAISASWSVQGTPLQFSGTFGNNLQGSGSYAISGQPGINRQTWTAQLGETNVPLKIGGIASGSITIAGSQVTFNLGNQSATANIDPASGLVTSGPGFSLGFYTSVSGTFTSNTSGSGSFGFASKKQGGANWGTDVSS